MGSLKAFGSVIFLAALCANSVIAQGALTWEEIQERFEAANPTLKASQLNVDESRAAEVTANLRPNPEITAQSINSIPWRAWPPPSRGCRFTGLSRNALPYASLGYLHERAHKRELRLESARKSTEIADSAYSDQKRTLTFNLRNAFVQTLQWKATVGNARENLTYWDREVSR